SNYEQALAEAMKCVSIEPDNLRYHFNIFCAQVVLGQYDAAEVTHRAIIQHPKANHRMNLNALGAGEPAYHIYMRLQRYAAKYIFDTLEASRAWHPINTVPEGPAFRAMTEAADFYQYLKKIGRRSIRSGFGGSWSPDGSKMVYNIGIPGFSGLAILDLETGERKLLAVPGLGHAWSPDGKYIAYKRQRKIMTSAMLADQTKQPEAFDIEELCLILANGTEEPRLLTEGDHPQWNASGEYLYYQSHSGLMTMRISAVDKDVQPEPVVLAPAFYPEVSPDGKYIAEAVGNLRITDIATGQVVETWRGPLWCHFVKWSPDGHQLAISGGAGRRTGVWIYDRRKNEGRKIINGPVHSLGWSPDGKQFGLALSFPYVETWIIDIPEGSSLQQMFSLGMTVQEHSQALIDYYDKAIEAAPDYTELYLHRAEQALWLYGEQGASAYLHDFELALSRCDFAPFSLSLYIWFKQCWPPSKRCRIMSPLSIILAEKIGWMGAVGLAHYRAGHWKKTVELIRPKVEQSEAGAMLYFLHAMSCWQLKQKEQARASYVNAMEWLESNESPLATYWLQAEATLLLGMPETEIMELRSDK
ncbi:MAG: hypothetical protein ACYSWP_23255, partial [Planctomycetota bacterium]